VRLTEQNQAIDEININRLFCVNINTGNILSKHQYRVDDFMNVFNSRRYTSDESGTALVEFLLVFPILMLLIVGVVQFGVMFITWSAMYNAARDTARHLAEAEQKSVKSTTKY
jgi:hypothetical protein